MADVLAWSRRLQDDSGPRNLPHPDSWVLGPGSDLEGIIMDPIGDEPSDCQVDQYDQEHPGSHDDDEDHGGQFGPRDSVGWGFRISAARPLHIPFFIGQRSQLVATGH